MKVPEINFFWFLKLKMSQLVYFRFAIRASFRSYLFSSKSLSEKGSIAQNTKTPGAERKLRICLIGQPKQIPSHYLTCEMEMRDSICKLTCKCKSTLWISWYSTFAISNGKSMLAGLGRRCRTIGVWKDLSLEGVIEIAYLPAISFLWSDTYWDPMPLHTHERSNSDLTLRIGFPDLVVIQTFELNFGWFKFPISSLNSCYLLSIVFSLLWTCA